MVDKYGSQTLTMKKIEQLAISLQENGIEIKNLDLNNSYLTLDIERSVTVFYFRECDYLITIYYFNVRGPKQQSVKTVKEATKILKRLQQKHIKNKTLLHV